MSINENAIILEEIFEISRIIERLSIYETILNDISKKNCQLTKYTEEINRFEQMSLKLKNLSWLKIIRAYINNEMELIDNKTGKLSKNYPQLLKALTACLSSVEFNSMFGSHQKEVVIKLYENINQLKQYNGSILKKENPNKTKLKLLEILTRKESLCLDTMEFSSFKGPYILHPKVDTNIYFKNYVFKTPENCISCSLCLRNIFMESFCKSSPTYIRDVEIKKEKQYLEEIYSLYLQEQEEYKADIKYLADIKALRQKVDELVTKITPYVMKLIEDLNQNKEFIGREDVRKVLGLHFEYSFSIPNLEIEKIIDKFLSLYNDKDRETEKVFELSMPK